MIETDEVIESMDSVLAYKCANPSPDECLDCSFQGDLCADCPVFRRS